MDRKHWEKEKLLITSNFSFSQSVFKRLVSQRRQKVSLCGNGLRQNINQIRGNIHQILQILLFTSNFSFFHSVFKALVLQTCKNQGLFGKGLRIFLEGELQLGRALLLGEIRYVPCSVSVSSEYSSFCDVNEISNSALGPSFNTEMKYSM